MKEYPTNHDVLIECFTDHFGCPRGATLHWVSAGMTCQNYAVLFDGVVEKRSAPLEAVETPLGKWWACYIVEENAFFCWREEEEA